MPEPEHESPWEARNRRINAEKLAAFFGEAGPPPNPDPFGPDRASGNGKCPTCDRPIYDHPLDPEEIGYHGQPFLTILCDGRRVKT